MFVETQTPCLFLCFEAKKLICRCIIYYFFSNLKTICGHRYCVKYQYHFIRQNKFASVISVISLPILRQQKNCSGFILTITDAEQKCIGYFITVTEGVAAMGAVATEAAAKR